MMFMAEAQNPGTEAQAPKAEAQPQPAAAAQALKPAKAKRAPAKKRAKKAERIVFATSKRKESVARASAKKGTGVVRVNSRLGSTIKPREMQMMMLTPIYLSELARSAAAGIDIEVNVNGGGLSSQAQAVGGAIARVIMGFSEGDTMKKEYMRYDRSLVIDDSRRVEPKKFRGPKARARSQTSYR